MEGAPGRFFLHQLLLEGDSAGGQQPLPQERGLALVMAVEQGCQAGGQRRLRRIHAADANRELGCGDLIGAGGDQTKGRAVGAWIHSASVVRFQLVHSVADGGGVGPGQGIGRPAAQGRPKAGQSLGQPVDAHTTRGGDERRLARDDTHAGQQRAGQQLVRAGGHASNSINSRRQPSSSAQ
jgi:hypothetical protein